MDPSNVNWLAVVVAALSAFVIGGLWYSPLLFHQRWLAASGVAPDLLKTRVPATFIGAFVCAFIASANLAFFLGPAPTVQFGVGAGAAAGIGWVATGLTTTMLFERRPLPHIVIDAGYHVVALTVMGTILGAWH